jgi:DNA-directed RNA polymerase alpha subunit
MKKIKRVISEISEVSSRKDTLTFKIKNINVSFVNALRRTILSDIPTVVFKTIPYESNLCTIEENTSRLNNEILKQRLSCIPIHIKDLDSIENLEVEIDEENTSDSATFVTTKDFKIKNTLTDKYLSETEVRKIFPEDEITKEYILFNRLRSKISNSLPGEKIKLKCKLSTSTAGDNGSFNIVSTCTYYNADDVTKQNTEWNKYSKTLKDKSKTEISKEKKNWFVHKSKKYYKKDMFHFIIETIGVYTNIEIIKKACAIIKDKLDKLQTIYTNDPNFIQKSNSISDNSFTITLPEETYTIGKIIEYILYNDYYKNGPELCYVGFVKKHPHNKNSIIKIVFSETDGASIGSVQSILNYAIEQCKNTINHIDESFG